MIGTCKGLARRVHRKMLEFRLLGRFLLRLSTYKQGRTNKLLRGLKSRPVKTKKVAAPAPRKKSHMSFQYYIKIYIFECYHFLHTDDIYILMLLYKWTLVNVGSICIRSSVWVREDTTRIVSTCFTTPRFPIFDVTTCFAEFNNLFVWFEGTTLLNV